jgi:hypothetical protein
MAKASPLPYGSNTGYTDWGVLRTIREAENIARWNPWLAHEWMEEARNRLDIYSAPYHEQYDTAVRRINALWKSNSQCHWYDAKEFWKRGKVSYPPKMLEPLFDE